MLYREHAMDARRVEPDGDGPKRWDVSVSSEAEIERSGWDGDFVEVLSHTEDAVDMARLRSAAPVLLEHNSRDQIGVVEKAYLKDRTLRAVIRFSRSARGREVEQDVEDGIRRNISVGYLPRKMRLDEDNNGKKKYRVTRWQPGEISVVSIPADITVGIGRASSGGELYPVEIEPAEGGKKMAEQVKPADPKPDEKPAIEVSGEVQARLDAAEIQRMCDANKMGHRAKEFLEQGKTVPEVSHIILMERKGDARPAGPAPEAPKKADGLDGLPEKDRRRYSYARALKIAAGVRDGTADFDGLEAEVHTHLEKNRPAAYQARGGIFVPLDLRTIDQAWDEREKRALDSKTLAKGSEAVFDVPGQLIELLRNRAAVVQLGAVMLTGLSGPVAFPKQTSAMTAYWVGENPGADVTASDPGLGLVTLQPKTLQATTSYSRQLLAQATVDIENLVRNDLANIHALAIDKAALHGAGTAGEPTGIYIAPDVQAKAMTVPTYAVLVDMIGLVADKNATLGTLGWVTTPLMASKLLQTLMFSAAGSDTVWQGTLEVGGTGTIAGYRAVSTSQVSKTLGAGAEHGIVFANWADLLVGLFGSLEIVVDPYAQKKRGMIEVTSFQMADLILRHGDSFAKSTGAVLA
jgi:HK97 family phage major capsid protein